MRKMIRIAYLFLAWSLLGLPCQVAAQDRELSDSMLTQLGDSHPKQSGFKLILKGSDAFLTRIAMIRKAHSSIDIQYYNFDDDQTGKILLQEILKAADRGVQVRLLIDALNVGKLNEFASALQMHPHIIFKSFNPITQHDTHLWARLADYVRNLDDYDKRMHNKVFVVDGHMALIGGRNIGDTYFDASDDFNFSDVDVFILGALLPDIEKNFTQYWESINAVLVTNRQKPDAIALAKKKLAEGTQTMLHTPLGGKLRELIPEKQLFDGKEPFIWADAELTVDDPDKITEPAKAMPQSPVRALDTLLAHAQQEFVGVAPYLVPEREGVERLSALVKRGVKVKLLTNSLASTDVVAVHGAYEHYRPLLIKDGIDLYEFKPIRGKRAPQTFLGSSSRSSLHAKVYVVDRRYVIIGSFNLDPRSFRLNTESAIVIDSIPLAQRVLHMFGNAMAPAASYHIVADNTRSASKVDEPPLLWVSSRKGKQIIYHSDPHPGVFRYLYCHLTMLFDLENQL